MEEKIKREKCKAASEMAKMRWAKKTPEERKAYSEMMNRKQGYGLPIVYPEK